MESDPDENISLIAIFPLDVVLFPGALLPLHIFEERYKAMMRYAIDNGNCFGISYRSDASVGEDTAPHIGSVGCEAAISAVMPLEEGRMNILSTGSARYRVLEFKQIVPFLIARAETFWDESDLEDDLTAFFDETRELAERFIETIRSLNEPSAPPSTSFPEDIEPFSLFISSLLPIENDAKQELLEMTSTRLRLTRVRQYLTKALALYQERIEIRTHAKKNGHGRLKASDD
ncbi:MAG: hypothetical protein DMF61_00545 [Blastocatellia bacterium AA13]|nr:MAG: hypothetical protein DMF61_00545 [Blastocatellia bacterium AA13]